MPRQLQSAPDEATVFQIEKNWMVAPVGDIEFVLDTILKQAQDPESGAVYQLVDPAKIGLMGHSLGGESAAEVAREQNDIGAMVNLDADLVHIQGTDHMSVTDVPIISPFLASMLVNSVPKGGGGAPADQYRVIETVNHLVLTFFNAFLKGEGTFTPAATY